jgi:hypothetical protein
MMAQPFFTIGHSTRPLEELTSLRATSPSGTWM